MTICNSLFPIALALSTVIAWSGCGKPNEIAKPPNSETGHHDGDGHDRDHGKAADEKHAHGEVGPHQGQLLELGHDEYHAELVHDHAANSVTVYLLDASAKTAVPIPDSEIELNLAVDGSPLQVKLAASPQPGDPTGQASRFSLADQKLVDALESPKTTGRLNLKIGGKDYTSKIEH